MSERAQQTEGWLYVMDRNGLWSWGMRKLGLEVRKKRRVKRKGAHQGGWLGKSISRALMVL